MDNFAIESIRITDLFGYIPEHMIEMKEGGVTFIHGPNGCGKTTCLKLIDAVFNLKRFILQETDFSSIEIKKSNKTTLIVEKENKRLTFKLGKEKFSIDNTINDIIDKISPSVISEIDEYVPSLRRIDQREWIDVSTNTRMGLPEVIEKYHDRLPFIGQEVPSYPEYPDWLKSFVSSVKTRFIKTQRLLRVDDNRPKRNRFIANRFVESVSNDAIQDYSVEIKELINKKLAEQAAESQKLDRSFPQRLLSMTSDITATEDNIRLKYRDTEENIQKMIKTGLIEKQENIFLPTKAMNETERRVLSLYLDDSNQKLNVFNDLQKKIETFLDIINSKFKSKQFSINREEGFCIQLVNSDMKLGPSQLSSGEQHQIVLFYELIFKATDTSLFLIDEPEISLHVDWQRTFIDDIHRIAQIGDRQFIIATHSPQIIGKYRDLAVALNEGILDE